MTSAGQFLGYHRPDGRVGVRNHLLVLSTGGLTGPTARRIGAALQGAVTVCLPHSSGLLGPDARLHRTAVEAFATHPNVGAVVMVGDNPPVMARAVEVAERAGKPHAAFTLDDCNHDALTLTDRALRAGAGAQLVLFTTGVGNSYVSALAPTLKLSANPVTCAALGQQLDFDAGDAFRGRVTIDHAADLLESRMVEIASGRATWGEVLKEGDEVLSRFAPAL